MDRVFKCGPCDDHFSGNDWIWWFCGRYYIYFGLWCRLFNAKKITEDITFDKNEILDCKWITVEEIEKMEKETLRNSKTLLDIVKDIKNNKNYPLEMIKYFKS